MTAQIGVTILNMPTPAESAELILKLYDLRREDTMRKARDFMVSFDPRTFEEFMAGFTGPNSGYVRMVTSYWEMAASLVVNGAIDAKMFLDANGEHILTFSKVQPFLSQLREMFQNPNVMKSLETLVLSQPDGQKRVDSTREMIRNMIAMRSAAAKS